MYLFISVIKYSISLHDKAWRIIKTLNKFVLKTDDFNYPGFTHEKKLINRADSFSQMYKHRITPKRNLTFN